MGRPRGHLHSLGGWFIWFWGKLIFTNIWPNDMADDGAHISHYRIVSRDFRDKVEIWHIEVQIEVKEAVLCVTSRRHNAAIIYC